MIQANSEANFTATLNIFFEEMSIINLSCLVDVVTVWVNLYKEFSSVMVSEVHVYC